MQGVVNEEIFQAFHNKTRLEENIASIPGQLQEYFDSEILAPTVSYFNETLAQHLSGLKPNISEVLLSLITQAQNMQAEASPHSIAASGGCVGLGKQSLAVRQPCGTRARHSTNVAARQALQRICELLLRTLLFEGPVPGTLQAPTVDITHTV